MANPPDTRALRRARQARREDGLQDTFSRQTDIRNEISETQRLLRDLPQYQMNPDVLGQIKGLLQDTLASRAVDLFRLSEPMN